MNLLQRLFRYRHRKFRRYRAQNGLTVVLDRKSPRGDEVIDFGMGGLTFNYVDMGELLQERFEIDIYVDGNPYSENVKAKLVSNIEVGDISFQGKNIRRISVQFSSLTPVQEFDLKTLIKSHGIE